MEVPRNVAQTLEKLWKYFHCAEDTIYQKTDDASGASDQRSLTYLCAGVLMLTAKLFPNSEITVADRLVKQVHVISVMEHLLF